MRDQVLSKRGKALSRRLGRLSLAGDGLLERMRSTTFALLGITAAMALGLVAIAAQQGWPDLPFSPIPGHSATQGKVGDAAVVAAAESAGSGPGFSLGRSRVAAVVEPGGGDAAGRGGSRLSGSRELEGPEATDEPGTGGSPQPAPVSPEQQSSAAPVSSPAPVSNPAPTPVQSPTLAGTPSAPGPITSGVSPEVSDNEDEEKQDDGKDEDGEDAEGHSPSRGKDRPSRGSGGGKHWRDDLPAPAPVPDSAAEGPPPEPEVPEASSDESKQDSSWGNGRGRGRSDGKRHW